MTALPGSSEPCSGCTRAGGAAQGSPPRDGWLSISIVILMSLRDRHRRGRSERIDGHDRARTLPTLRWRRGRRVGRDRGAGREMPTHEVVHCCHWDACQPANLDDGKLTRTDEVVHQRSPAPKHERHLPHGQQHSLRALTSGGQSAVPPSAVQAHGLPSGECLSDADHGSVTSRLVPEHVVQTRPADPGRRRELGHGPAARDNGSAQAHGLKSSGCSTPQGTVRPPHRPVRPLLDGVERVYSHHLLNPVLDAGSDIWLRMNLRWVARGGGIPPPLYPSEPSWRGAGGTQRLADRHSRSLEPGP